MIQFYVPGIEETTTLPQDESAHCCRVLRKRNGDSIYVIDGKGNRYLCTITDDNPKATVVSIEEKTTLPKHWQPRITLAVAPTKNADRMEWLVEKCVEMGVDRIVILRCDRSERKVLKTERLHKIMVSAMKQSLKTLLPELLEMMSMDTFLEEARSSGAQCFIAYCDEAVERKLFAKEYDGSSDVTILIGPEGDFSPAEVEKSLAAGFQPVSFGGSRLRTETAAIYSVAAVHTLIQLKDR